ncbi:Cytochrome c biogenesis ATP-binding export protein CcmA [Methylovirgula sp. HY1]|nr:Cytochrome c biogenesis ATP-binding export protein CcmA [Methylovirgula sp. HY1]
MQIEMQIEGSALAVERGGRIIFTNIGFRLAAGEALLVTGPNGAGKSSLLRAIAGLLPLAEGQITVAPTSEARLPELCHYVGHADALKPSLTVYENLAFWAAFLASGASKGGSEEGIEAALAQLGLTRIADLPAAYLSAGQKRRAALARLLAVYRPLWLLDEPGTALDAASQKVLGAIMLGHLDAGGMIIAATHAPLGLPARELVLGRAA